MKRWGWRAALCPLEAELMIVLSVPSPAELQAQGKLHNLLNWVLLLFLSPPCVPSILPSPRTDGKTDENTPIRLFEALH